MALTADQIRKNDAKIAATCPACFGDLATHTGRTDYQELYLTILQIGQTRVNHGMRYSDLLIELSKRGFNIDNGCLKQAVKQWFHDAYFHITVAGNTCNIDELDEHSDCTFILKGESSLLLLEHDKISKTISLAKWAIMAAIVIGVLAISVSWYVAYHPTVNEGKKDEQQKAPQIPQVQPPIFRQHT